MDVEVCGFQAIQCREYVEDAVLPSTQEASVILASLLTTLNLRYRQVFSA